VASPIPPTVDASVAEQVQRRRNLSDDMVIEDLTRTFGSELPAVWRAAADQPRRWLESYASATVHVWSVVAPRWQRAQPLLDLEARRVGAAVVRGCTDVLLNTLHPRMHYEDGEFWVPATRESRMSLARGAWYWSRRSLVYRVGSGSTCPTSSISRTRCRGRRVWASMGRVMDPDGDPLCRMLGGMRAHMLRMADGPVSMGQLAVAVGCSPRVTSYHCDHLEATGLIVRERRGKSVWVSRTARGHELVDMLSA
jgi:hypothetical protein